jgi:RNA-directed DNA polymerase
VPLLNLSRPEQLAELLATSCPHLFRVLRQADEHYCKYILKDPRKPHKARLVFGATGVLRVWQSRFYSTILLPNIDRSPHSHGGVPGKSVLTNVEAHLRQAFVYTADIASFYPNIHRERVARLFKRLGCTEKVALICTRLCTHRNCLEQGLITSPILADMLMRPADERIAAACREITKETGKTVVFSRFVDDLAVSASFDLRSSGIPNLINRILKEHGFRRNIDKDQFGAVDDNASITRLRFPNGHPDVERNFILELERQLADHARLGRGEEFDGPYYTQQQIRGRVLHVCRINRGRRRHLMAKLAGVNWTATQREASRRGLVVLKKQLIRLAR